MKKTLRQIINHIKSADYKRIDVALEMLEKHQQEAYYRVLLRDLFLTKEGHLYVPPAFVQNNTHQAKVDYAFWQILGMAPVSVLKEYKLYPFQLKRIEFVSYESYQHHWHYMHRFPDKITAIDCVEELYASDGKFTTLPASIGNWKKLKVLEISGNIVNQLPHSLGQLTELRKLYAPACGLKRLPNIFHHLTKLELLDFSRNNIKQLPESMGKLKKLITINLYQNQISEFQVALNKMIQLVSLNLSSNKFSKFPTSIASHAYLKNLYFNNNPITEIPETIAQMKALQKLELNDCCSLKSLPYQMQELNHLKQLSLGRSFQLRPKPHRKFLENPQDFEIYFNKLKRKAGILKRKKTLRTDKPIPKVPTPSATIKPVPSRSFNTNTQPIKTPAVVYQKETEEDIQAAYILSLLQGKTEEAIELGFSVLEMSVNPKLLKLVFDEFYDTHHRMFNIPKTIVNERLLSLLLDFNEQGWLNEKFDCSHFDSLHLHSHNEKLAHQLNKFTKLESLKLTLDDNHFQHKMPVLQQLQSLILKGSNSGKWDWEHLFPNLKFLDLEGIQMEQLAPIESHPILQQVNLSSGTSENITLRQCPNLCHVRVSNNWRKVDASQLIVTIENCDKLSSIEITTGNCKKLSIRNCPKLREIKVSSGYELEFDIEQPVLEKLKLIQLTNCNFKECPEFISQCVALESLDVSNNELNRLPDFLRNLTQLKSLNARNNNLKWFPEQVFSLLLMETIDFYNNPDLKVRWQYPAIYKDGFKLLVHLKVLKLSWNESKKRRVRFMGIQHFK